MAASATIHVRGLKGLLRALKDFPDDVADEFVGELVEAVDPARERATTLMHEMVNVQSPYDEFRVGVSAKTVYIAPAWRRGSGSPRPGMAPHMRRRMERAVEEERAHIIDKVDDMLDRIADHHGF